MKQPLLVLLLSLMGAAVYAGPGKKAGLRSHISLGPLVSLGHSWVHEPLQTDNKFKFAPAAGIGLVYSTEEHLGFGAQLLVSHEGFRREFPTIAGTGIQTVNPVYLRLPLHVIYFFGKYGDRVRPKIYAGPSLAYKVDEQHYYGSNEAETLLAPYSPTKFYRNIDAGLSIGLGANVRLSRATWLNLDAGYYHGLVGAVEGYGNKNRNLRLNVGLMWGL